MSKKKKASTNITPEHQMVFDMLRSQDPGFALMSCFVNGEPTSAICHMSRLPGGAIRAAPFFVAVTPGMKVLDHAGDAPQAG